VSARFQTLFVQPGVITGCSELSGRLSKLLKEEQDGVAKAIRVKGELAIMVHGIGAETETGSLDAMLVGVEQVEHGDSEEQERKRRHTDAQSPNDPLFRE
jgi:hypothetical protein